MVFEIRVCTFRKVNTHLAIQMFLKVGQFRSVPFYGMTHKMGIIPIQKLWSFLVRSDVLRFHANNTIYIYQYFQYCYL